MATRLPLVMNAGQVQQLQVGDSIATDGSNPTNPTLAFGVCDFRLNCVGGGAAFSPTDQTAKSVLYLTPVAGYYGGTYLGRIAVPTPADVRVWNVITLGEKSLTLTGLGSGKNYDAFAYQPTLGTLVLVLGPAWASDTARAATGGIQAATAGTAMTNVSAFTDPIGGGTIAAGAGVWMGTVRTTGTTTVEDSLAKRFVWSAWHQLPRTLYYSDFTGHTYATNTTRQYRGVAAQVDFVLGLPAECVATAALGWSNPTLGQYCIGGSGLDVNNVENGQVQSNILGDLRAAGLPYPYRVGIGRHVIALTQRTIPSGSAPTYSAGELSAVIVM